MKRSKVMMFPFGIWDTKKYGKLPLTEGLADKIIANFSEKVLGRDPFVDEVHNQGKATGWIKSLSKKASALFADIEWTPLGEKLLSEGTYRYFSVQIDDHIDPTSGETYHNVLKGGALCNNPVLSQMPAIELSENQTFKLSLAHEIDKGGNTIGELIDEEAKLSLVKNNKNNQEGELMKDEALRKLLNLSEDDDIGEALKKHVADSKKADKLEIQLSDIKTAEDERLAKEKADADKNGPKIELSEAEVSTLKINAAAGLKASQDLYTLKRNTTINVALSEGRIAPVDKEKFETHFDALAKAVNIEAAEGLINDLPVQVDLAEHGSGGHTKDNKVPLTKEDKQIAAQLNLSEDDLIKGQEVNVN